MNKNTPQQQVSRSIERAVKSDNRIRFLCDYNRDWVYFHSKEALENLDQMQLKGEFLLEHQKWVEALSLIGCAWKTSEISLELHKGEKTFLVNRFGCLTMFLMSCLEKMGYQECAEQINQQTQSTLNALALQLEESSEQRVWLMSCIAQLQASSPYQIHLLPFASEATDTILH